MEQPITHKVPIIEGFVSLIGVDKSSYPIAWANYFDLLIGEKRENQTDLEHVCQNAVRVLNMWSENLAEAKIRFLHDGLVEIRQYGRHCIIVDERIPKEWRYDKLCFTGGPRISIEIAKDIYEFLGDPTNELERFTNPKNYWESRGWIYRDNGVVSKVFSDKK